MEELGKIIFAAALAFHPAEGALAETRGVQAAHDSTHISETATFRQPQPPDDMPGMETTVEIYKEPGETRKVLVPDFGHKRWKMILEVPDPGS